MSAPQSRRGSTGSTGSRKGSKSQITFNESADPDTPAKKPSKGLVGAAKGVGSALSGLGVTSTPKKQHAREDKKSEKPEKYTPMPYTFRITDPQQNKEVKKGAAKCPPYYLQLDHTLAVIWMLFSEDVVASPLGIVQLQWALGFLKGIYNRKGEHPKDIELCIQTIQDQLIEQYAEMVDDVQYIKKSSPKKKPEDKPKSQQEGDVSGKSTGDASDPDKSPDQPEACTDDTCEALKDSKNDEKSLISKKAPFSINYSEMIDRTPPGIQQIFPATEKVSFAPEPTYEKPSTQGMQLTDSVSRDNMIGFLKAWRVEQVEKLQAELKRLRSIERFIGNVEQDNFSPYVNGTDLDDLIARVGKRN